MSGVRSTNKMTSFKRIYVCDTEFIARDGEPHRPVCVCIVELRSGERFELFGEPHPCPISWREDDLMIGYQLMAELKTFLSLGWELPPNNIDLRYEQLMSRNGAKAAGMIRDSRVSDGSASLVTALYQCGRDELVPAGKQDEREYIMANGTVPPAGVSLEEHKRRITAYCWEDVFGTSALIHPYLRTVRLDQAIERGRSAVAFSHCEANGIPVDTHTLELITKHRPAFLLDLKRRTEDTHHYGVFRPDGTQSKKGFEAMVERNGWLADWPRVKGSGSLSADKDTMKLAAVAHPELAALANLLRTNSQARGTKITAGADGRSRPNVWPFEQATGRCSPKGDCVLGLAMWYRFLIKPPKGYALVCVDIEGQEFATQGALSGDPQILRIYRSGSDQYLELAKISGAVPQTATKKSHPDERRVWKVVSFACSYGAAGVTLAGQIGNGCTPLEAESRIRIHHEFFEVYWAYAYARVRLAYEQGYIESEMGWRRIVTHKTKRNTLLNFPQQANGAEILRLAFTLAVDRGLAPYLCYPHHDAAFLLCPDEMAEQMAVDISACFADAGRVVLGDSLTLRTEPKIIRYPDRYRDERGEDTWNLVQAFIESLNTSPFE